MPVISVIIPCYNSFNKMKDCFLSLEKQLFNDFEVIVIDDYSTDNSYGRLLDYKKNTKLNIRVLRNEKNSGPGRSRNRGLEVVKGDYVTFLDSDDYLEKNCLQVISDLITEKKADCIIFDYYLVMGKKRVHSKSISNFNSGWISKRQALINSTSSTWCKVYNSKVILDNDITFPDLKRNEDMPFNKIAISFCDQIYYLPQALYNYIMNQDSLMHNRELDNENNAISAFQLIEEKLQGRYLYEVEAIFIKELLYPTVMTMLQKKYNRELIDSHIEKWERKYPEWKINPEIRKYSTYQRICINNIKKRKYHGLRVLSIIRILKRKFL